MTRLFMMRPATATGAAPSASAPLARPWCSSCASTQRRRGQCAARPSRHRPSACLWRWLWCMASRLHGLPMHSAGTQAGWRERGVGPWHAPAAAMCSACGRSARRRAPVLQRGGPGPARACGYASVRVAPRRPAHWHRTGVQAVGAALAFCSRTARISSGLDAEDCACLGCFCPPCCLLLLPPCFFAFFSALGGGEGFTSASCDLCPSAAPQRPSGSRHTASRARATEENGEAHTHGAADDSATTLLLLLLAHCCRATPCTDAGAQRGRTAVKPCCWRPADPAPHREADLIAIVLHACPPLRALLSCSRRRHGRPGLRCG